MAAKKIYALNLGMQTVALAEFELLPDGGLALSAYREYELMPDPAADATRLEQIKVAVGELRSGLNLPRSLRAYLSLPSQAVFTRFLKLPGSTAEDVKSVIGFEAQQNVPFPIAEVVWDYQILGPAREANWDVALVAIKTDQLEEIYGACEQAGVGAHCIDIAPMAIYNAFRFNYSDVTGASLIIDMGARTTNLIFAEGEKVFTRTIPIGGNLISVNVAKELGVEVTVAEALKKEKGFVALGGAYADPADPTEAKICKIARTTMTRLHAEITRSISFYRANHGGSQPVRAFLAGRNMNMPFMLEFFAEKLTMPVEFFNPVKNVLVPSEAVRKAIDGKIPALGELVGLGLRGAGVCPVEISLTPKKVLVEQDLSKKQLPLIAAVLCITAALLSLVLFFQQAADKVLQVTDGVRRDIARLEKIQKSLAEADEKITKLQAIGAPLILAVEERTLWIQILDELGKNLPPRFLWITKLTPLSGGQPVNLDGVRPQLLVQKGARPIPTPTPTPKPTPPGRRGAPPPKPTTQEEVKHPTIDAIRIDGLYLENPAMVGIVDQFVDNLAKSPLFAVNEEVKINMVRTQPDGTSWAYSYSFVLPLAKPISLP